MINHRGKHTYAQVNEIGDSGETNPQRSTRSNHRLGIIPSSSAAVGAGGLAADDHWTKLHPDIESVCENLLPSEKDRYFC